MSWAFNTEPVADPEQSLAFPLMAAARHMELGEFQAGITALCDALWIAHEGKHEELSDFEVVRAIRRIGGLEWAPPEDR